MVTLMPDEIDSLWEATRALWRKYCGVTDEYRTLKNRWLYLKDFLNPVLPNLADNEKKIHTFDILTDYISAIDNLFETELNLKRNKEEVLDHETLSKLKNLDFEMFSKLKYYFFDVSQYVGLLKLAFFQRTVSLEIPQLEAGIPHSPERTIGNEMIYVSADKIAETYWKCLKVPHADWDGFITFAPPITEEAFYGAFCKPTKNLSLFHISMSEEQKYFLGAFLHLAHEMGHAAIYGNDTENPTKFEIMARFIVSVTRNTWVASHSWCGFCDWNPNKMVKESRLGPFNEYLADVIAYNIGGIYTVEAFLDENFNNIDFAETLEKVEKNGTKTIKVVVNPPTPSFILQMNAILNYIELTSPQEAIRLKALRSRYLDLLRRSENTLVDYFKFVDNKGYPQDIDHELKIRENCLSCLSNLGEKWSEIFISEFDKEFVKGIVNKKFLCPNADVLEIKKSIVEGNLLLDVDPRLILHCYYELYKEKSNSNFSSVSCSLAYNNF